MRRKAWTRLFAVLATVGLLTACTPDASPKPSSSASAPHASGSGSASPSPSVSASGQPAAALRSAVAQLAGQRLRFLLGSPNDREQGEYDPATGLGSLEQTQDGKRLQIITAGPQMYLRGATPDGSILRVDLARLPDNHGLVPLADPVAVLHLISGAVDVVRTTDSYTGKLDLTRVDPGPSPATQRMVARFLGAAAERAGAVPFVAQLDEEGRLQTFRATFPKADLGRELQYEFTVVDVGGPVTVNLPSGPTVIDAPSSVYAP